MASHNSEAAAILEIPKLVRAAVGPDTGINLPVSVKAHGHKTSTWDAQRNHTEDAIFFTLTIETLAPFEHKE